MPTCAHDSLRIMVLCKTILLMMVCTGFVGMHMGMAARAGDNQGNTHDELGAQVAAPDECMRTAAHDAQLEDEVITFVIR